MMDEGWEREEEEEEEEERAAAAEGCGIDLLELRD